MSKEARGKIEAVSPAVREKIRELAELMARERCVDGLPSDLTFSEIEEWGHQAGRLLAAAVDQHVLHEHRAQLAAEQACPQCSRPCVCQSRPRELVTRDGPVELTEAVCYCTVCRRSFFPSAGVVEAGRSGV